MITKKVEGKYPPQCGRERRPRKASKKKKKIFLLGSA